MPWPPKRVFDSPADIARWEAEGARLLSEAKKIPPVQVPWTAAEDEVLLALLEQYHNDLQEWQMKIAGVFQLRCGKPPYGTSPAEREHLAIVQRAWSLRERERQKAVARSKASGAGTGDRLVNEPSSSKNTTAKASSSSNAAASRQAEGSAAANRQAEEKSAPVSRQTKEASESESDEDEVIEVVKVKKKKQRKVIEIEKEEEGTDGESEEAGAEGKQTTQYAASSKPTADNDQPRGTKREATLLIEGGGKRLRIGIPPKGTKVACFPEQGLVKLEF